MVQKYRLHHFTGYEKNLDPKETAKIGVEPSVHSRCICQGNQIYTRVQCAIVEWESYTERQSKD